MSRQWGWRRCLNACGSVLCPGLEGDALPGSKGGVVANTTWSCMLLSWGSSDAAHQGGARVSPLLGPCACYGAVGTVILPAGTLPCLSPVPLCPLVAVAPTSPVSPPAAMGSGGPYSALAAHPGAMHGSVGGRGDPNLRYGGHQSLF